MNENKRTAKFYEKNKNLRERVREVCKSGAALTAKLNERGVSISAESVRQWLGGYTCPKDENYRVLAEILDCSEQYLRGGDALPNIDDTQIHEITGLEQQSIDWLRELKSRGSEYERLVLNLLMTKDANGNVPMDAIISCVAHFMLADTERVYCLKDVSTGKIVHEQNTERSREIANAIATRSISNILYNLSTLFEMAGGTDGK